MDETEFARHVTSMKCLIAFIKVDSFDEGIQFVDYLSSLKGNPVVKTKKHLVLMSPTIDEALLKNKTIRFNVHIMRKDKAGMYAVVSNNYVQLVVLLHV